MSLRYNVACCTEIYAIRDPHGVRSDYRNPAIMNSQACIPGTRLTVRRALEALATYPDRDELRSEYPELDEEDIRQALEYAAANLDDEVLELGENSRRASNAGNACEP